MNVLEELHQDHVNLHKLLMLFQESISHIREGEPPNIPLINDVVNYISSYADGYHHPKEDRMYNHFRKRLPLLDQLLAICEDEHVMLKNCTDDFLTVIDEVLNDTVISMHSLSDVMEDYLAKQLNHLNFEEGEIFPLIKEQATSKDWKLLSASLSQRVDPIFGEKHAEEYISLYRELSERRDVA